MVQANCPLSLNRIIPAPLLFGLLEENGSLLDKWPLCCNRKHSHKHSESVLCYFNSINPKKYTFFLRGPPWKAAREGTAEHFRNDTLAFASAALLLKGSAVAKGSALVVFLKKSSEEALKGSTSLNGSPPKGSGRVRRVRSRVSRVL